MFPLLCVSSRGLHASGPELVLGGTSLVSGILSAVFASSRGRSSLGWFFIGFFLPWIGLALLFLVPDRRNLRVGTGVPYGTYATPPRPFPPMPPPPGVHPAAGAPIPGPVPPPMAPMEPVASSPPRTPAPPAEPPRPDGSYTTTTAAAALPEEGWYYATPSAYAGPVALEFIRGSVRAGTLPRGVHVWCSSFREWVPFDRVPGLKS